uniref:Defensin n=1 Tax=Mamestra brassicae TaxID=55057 RepID=DEF_MAMBR|nr:RecName: Full=Defensin; Flags: Precursor [Mamestra brassicae]AAL69980.2 defensin [Mamestra brassicae]
MLCLADIRIVASCSAAIKSGYGQQPWLAHVAGPYANSLFDDVPADSYHAAVEYLRLIPASCYLLDGYAAGRDDCRAHCIAPRNRRLYCASYQVCVCRY